MKVIDLLNKIANGEDLKEKYIKYFDRIDQEYDICMICEANIIYKLDETSIELNDEVEIIEEDNKIYPVMFMGESEIEKLGMLKDKINEIIDKLNEGE